MNDRLPWTRDEIEQLIPKVEQQLDEIEEQEGEPVKPLPAMTAQECLDYFARLMDEAHRRPLTRRECFLHGQLLCVYKMAVQAEMLGKKGRYFVVHESAIGNLFDAKG